MFSVKGILTIGAIALITSPLHANISLHGDASVNITSDTAVNAKNIAFDEARRQVLSDSLQQYTDNPALKQALKNASAANIATLVASSSIGDELSSNTTYSAKISITFDENAVRSWLTENNVQHWLPDTTNQDSFAVIAELSNKLPLWIDLIDIVRSEKIDINPQKISGNIINLTLPSDKRGAFTIALREHGWKYADTDGTLRIWK